MILLLIFVKNWFRVVIVKQQLEYIQNGGGGGGQIKVKPKVNKKLYEEIISYFEQIIKIGEKLRELIELILSYYSTLIELLSRDEIIHLIERIINNKKIREHLSMIIKGN